jgi:glycerol-3-phosphate dehydrogenase
MNRDEMLAQVEARREPWDVAVIGGGATGLGIAVDAASRGYATVLFEQVDFGKGTSSRATKLVHGGVRYLRQGNISLVVEALRERGRLLANAPHVTRRLPIVVPGYKWWEKPFYGLGLHVYDWLAWGHGIGSTRLLGVEETLRRLPTLDREGLRGGVAFFDGQFDDTRLLVSMARTAVQHGAAVVNYAPVVGLLKNGSQINGVVMRDSETGREISTRARVVVNATGVFADGVRRLDDPSTRPMLRPSQGVHIVLDRSFLPGPTAFMIPQTDDGRVLFAIPWNRHVVVGTTDTPTDDVSLEPRALASELDFILSHSRRYLSTDPADSDVRSVFVGLRPLVSGTTSRQTKSISREHTLLVEASGLVTMTGGKWTTYRSMAEETVDRAAEVGGLPRRACATATLRLHGATAEAGTEFEPYGTDGPAVTALSRSIVDGESRIHTRLDYLLGEVVWAAREEMARTVEDVLARRTRALFLDAEAARESAGRVASILAGELKRDEAWQRSQVEAFLKVSEGYRLQNLQEHGR